MGRDARKHSQEEARSKASRLASTSDFVKLEMKGTVAVGIATLIVVTMMIMIYGEAEKRHESPSFTRGDRFISKFEVDLCR